MSSSAGLEREVLLEWEIQTDKETVWYREDGEWDFKGKEYDMVEGLRGKVRALDWCIKLDVRALRRVDVRGDEIGR